MRLIAALLLVLANSSILLAAQECRCSHFPWRPKQCVKKCRVKVVNEASRNALVTSLGLDPSIADRIVEIRDEKPLDEIEELKAKLDPREYEETVQRLERVTGTQVAALFGASHERQIDESSRTAQEALQRAMEAGKLAEGKLLYEAILTDDKIKFGFDTFDLSPAVKAALDKFASQLKSQNADVYLEIQGHTDSVGSEKYNEELGLLRAEAVRRYLSQVHQFPLHRMNVVSYGESASVADNSTREGRSQNRRIALVVLE